MPSLTYNANATLTIPKNVFQIQVECRGGGGAGGGVTTNTNKSGAGGAGGQYAKSNLAVWPGAQHNIIVGGQKTGTTGDGTAGNDSSFDAAIQVDSISNANNTSNSALSWDHTCNGTNRILVVCVTNFKSGGAAVVSAGGITYNGVALTKVRADNNGANGDGSEIWYLVNPATGTNTISVTYGSTPAGIVGSAVSLVGVTQSASAIDANNGGTGSGKNITVSITTVANNAFIIDSVSYDDPTHTLTPTSPQTQITQTAISTSHLGASSWKGPFTTAGATSMGWTASADVGTPWVAQAISLKPATVVVAKGGAGGQAHQNGFQGGAGSTTNGIGDTVNAGGNGGNGGSFAGSGGGGEGGRSTGTGGNGGNGSSGVPGSAGTGGDGGDGSIGRTTDGNGGTGTAPGGAGAGGCATGSTDRSGGTGAAGQVVVYYATPKNHYARPM